MQLISRFVPLSLLGCALGAGLALASASEAEEGFKPIFNGKDLTGWDGNPKFWSVKDGAITGQTTEANPTKGNTFVIWRQGLLDDFVLRLQYRIVPNNDQGFGNSGIQYRSKDFGNWVIGGYQADFEAGTKFSGILYEERMTRGIMAARGEKVVWGEDGKKAVVGSVGDSEAIQAAIRENDWNDYEISASGYHFVHKINGRVTVDVVDKDAKKRLRQGVLALQLHQGPPMTVQFKNIRLKRLALGDLRKVVFSAGRMSHGPGDHEHNAGVQLFHNCIKDFPGVLSTFYLNGWPQDPTAFDNADAIVVYSDGGGGHPFVSGNHLDAIGAKMKEGVGLGCVHYAVEVPKNRGGKEFLQWIGGYFETNWSVNPHWVAEFDRFPAHPVANGVKPFQMKDEWYYHMRFVDGMKGVTPILSDLPPMSTLQRPDGPHSNNPDVRKAVENGEPQHVMWVYERPDGGRGFGFTGGHSHVEWGQEDFRKVVLNAVVWIAKLKVPENGVESTVTVDELKQNLDPKGR